MALAMPIAATQISFSQAENTLLTQAKDVGFAARAPPMAMSNVAATGAVIAEQGSGFIMHGHETHAVSLDFGGVFVATDNGPRITIRDHYKHHNAMRTEIIDQLEGQGFRVSPGEASFGSSCGVGRCRPDIIYRTPDGQVRIIEIKTGNADPSIRQTEIYPQISNGDAIPRGKVARRFGLRPGIALKDQGYPNGIPIEIHRFRGAGQ